MSKISFSYKPEPRGWNSAAISDGEQELILDASWLSDALRDLTGAVASLLESADSVVFSWQSTPGSWRWILTKENEKLRIQILHFERDFSKLEDSKGEPVFSAETDVMRFAIVVRGQLRQILNDVGLVTYKEMTTYDFPFSAYERLDAAIEARKAQSKAGHFSS